MQSFTVGESLTSPPQLIEDGIVPPLLWAAMSGKPRLQPGLPVDPTPVNARRHQVVNQVPRLGVHWDEACRFCQVSQHRRLRASNDGWFSAKGGYLRLLKSRTSRDL